MAAAPPSRYLEHGVHVIRPFRITTGVGERDIGFGSQPDFIAHRAGVRQQGLVFPAVWNRDMTVVAANIAHP